MGNNAQHTERSRSWLREKLFFYLRIYSIVYYPSGFRSRALWSSLGYKLENPRDRIVQPSRTPSTLSLNEAGCRLRLSRRREPDKKVHLDPPLRMLIYTIPFQNIPQNIPPKNFTPHITHDLITTTISNQQISSAWTHGSSIYTSGLAAFIIITRLNLANRRPLCKLEERRNVSTDVHIRTPTETRAPSLVIRKRSRRRRLPH